MKLSIVITLYYPEYNQLYPPFEHCVIILDLIFIEGVKFMKRFK
jgi:WbqC-like protein family